MARAERWPALAGGRRTWKQPAPPYSQRIFRESQADCDGDSGTCCVVVHKQAFVWSRVQQQVNHSLGEVKGKDVLRTVFPVLTGETSKNTPWSISLFF